MREELYVNTMRSSHTIFDTDLPLLSQLARRYLRSLNPRNLGSYLSLPVRPLSSLRSSRSLISASRSIRFRAGWKAQGHSIEELPFQALGGVKGSWLGLTLIVLVLIAQFYVVSGRDLGIVGNLVLIAVCSR